MKEQRKAFEKFRLDAILQHNIEESKRENPNYQRERRSTDASSLIHCSKCGKFTLKRYWYNHTKTCQPDSSHVVVPVPIDAIHHQSSSLTNPDFLDYITTKIRTDEVGKICLSDESIMFVGSVFFQKNKRKDACKQVGVRKTVRRDMRQIASLYKIFIKEKDVKPLTNDASDMFFGQNFEAMKSAILEYTAEGDKIKAGLKHNLCFLVKKCAKVCMYVHVICMICIGPF